MAYFIYLIAQIHIDHTLDLKPRDASVVDVVISEFTHRYQPLITRFSEEDCTLLAEASEIYARHFMDLPE